MAEEVALRAGRCWYCGEATLRMGDPPEHVIAAAIGAALISRRVCHSCNQAAGKVDQLFVQDWFIALERSEYALSDRRGEPPPHPRQQVRGKDDKRPYRINTRGGPWRLEPVPEVRANPDGTFSASAASEEEALRAIERQLGPLARSGIDLSKMTRSQVVPPEVEVSLTVRPSIYVRATAKMALGSLSLVWDDDWLDSADAKKLQRWLREEHPTDDDGNPIVGLPGRIPDSLQCICTPPEHLILLMPHGGEVRVMVILFGGQLLSLRVACAGQTQPRTGWRVDPQNRIEEKLPLEDFLLQAALRNLDDDADTDEPLPLDDADAHLLSEN